MLKQLDRSKYFFVLLLFLTPSAFGFFLDGDGHYALRPETRTNPAFSDKRGLYQATKQSFRLLGDVKANDKLNAKFQFRIFDNPRTAYLGDQAKPENCSNIEDGKNSQNGSSDDCEGRHQDTNQPGYEPYTPKLTEMYVEYAFDFCLLQAGRRGRDWGLGILLDSGRDPFEDSASIYDGATCSINLQKTQTLGFSFGYDRLAETGANIDVGVPETEDKTAYGPTKSKDDLDQYYVTIEYDDRKANEGASFNRQVGIYLSKITQQRDDSRGKDAKTKVDITFADLYTGFYFRNFALRNELVFRLGKSTDPSWTRYGGISASESDSLKKNNVNAIGTAGEIRWTLSRSGTSIGPKEYHQGTATSHDLIAEYAYAPGDRDGYFDEDDRRTRGSAKKVKAMAFHRNYKPAQILLNAVPEADDLRIDGVFDPGKVMNVTLLTLGYEFKSLAHGNFGAKFISAELNKGIPDERKQQIIAQENADREAVGSDNYVRGRRPVGFSGTHLGYELDLSYSNYLGKNVELGGIGAVAIPGPAWKVETSSPQITYSIAAQAIFQF